LELPRLGPEADAMHQASEGGAFGR
jgi:hypothetical protein